MSTSDAPPAVTAELNRRISQIMQGELARAPEPPEKIGQACSDLYKSLVVMNRQYEAARLRAALEFLAVHQPSLAMHMISALDNTSDMGTLGVAENRAVRDLAREQHDRLRNLAEFAAVMHGWAPPAQDWRV